MRPPQKRNFTLTLVAACLAAGLSMAAWGTPVPADAASAVEYGSLFGTFTPTAGFPLTNVVVIEGVHDIDGNPQVYAYNLDPDSIAQGSFYLAG